MSERFSLVIVSVILLMLGGFRMQTCQAFSYDLIIYGDAGLGWGFSADMITSPGPTIVLKQNDVLNLTLISHDGAPHQFFVDYNNDSILQSSEPHSSVFTTSSVFQFMADDLNDTFVYRCSFHPAIMYGTLTVNTPPIPEFPSFLILPLFMIATLLAVLVYRRRHTSLLNK
jgi:hypothetical protein